MNKLSDRERKFFGWTFVTLFSILAVCYGILAVAGIMEILL